MTRNEALKHFDENYVAQIRTEKIKEMEQYYLRNKEKHLIKFVEDFKKMCLKIKDMQSQGEKARIGYINYSILRTNIMEKNYEYSIDSFDKYWYFDKVECSTTYDVYWTFKFLEEFGQEIEKKRKQYFNKIIKSDIEKIVNKEISIYDNQIKTIARIAILYAVQSEEYKEISKEDVVEIRIGEYYGISKLIYK